jgi:hypothetical protein
MQSTLDGLARHRATLGEQRHQGIHRGPAAPGQGGAEVGLENSAPVWCAAIVGNVDGAAYGLLP